MRIEDLGAMDYREAWAAQERAHEEVLNGGEERVLLVEHPPTITFGRRAGVDRNLIASQAELDRLGVEVVQSDRGGDITLHGPGQVVAYPIVRLNDHALSVGGYVRRLEEAAIAALRELGVAAQKDACAIGVWVPDEGGRLAKICALGVRIRRGVSIHGIALNVETNLDYFKLIVPCGLVDRSVTSLRRVLGDATPPIAHVRDVLAHHLVDALTTPVQRAAAADDRT